MPAHRSIVISLAIVCVVASPVRGGAATVREAQIAIAFLAGACDVTARFVVDTAEPSWIDHIVMLVSGEAPAFAVTGAVAAPVQIVGRTAKLPVSLVGSGRNEYKVQYRYAVPPAPGDRCALVVPAAPSDGQSRAVRITVTLPPDTALLPDSFPALTWNDRTGQVDLGHVPSFVRVPFSQAGAPLSWCETVDVRRMVDVAAVLTIAIATALWLLATRRVRT
jgi:hypothetical protein